jgi:hypothetical protein
VIVGCHHCKHAANYSDPELLGHEEIEPSIPASYSAKLWCGLIGCGGFVDAIVPTGEVGWKEEIATWTYGGSVRCPNGHQFDPMTE